MSLNFVKNLKEKINHKLTAKEIFSIFGLFFVWRIVIQFMAYLGINRLNLNPDFASCWKPEEVSWYSYWIRWDSGWYFSIINRGYYWDGPDKFSNIAFFPFYPWLIKYLAWIFNGNYLVTGIILSNLALIFSCFYFYKLAKLDTSPRTASRAVFYLLIFPSSIFLISMYAEPLLLLFCLAAFFHARKNEWLACGVFGFLAALTKAFGVFLVLPLLLEYLDQRGFKLSKIKWNALCLALIPSGLGLFMFYLWQKFNDPLLFLKAQGGWGGGPRLAWSRTPDLSLANIGESFSKYFQTIFGKFETSAFRITASFELFSFVLFAILCLVVFFKLRKSYALYMACGLVLSPLTGSLMSMNRYVLVLFPAFILMAIWGKNKLVNYTIILLFLMLLTLNTLMYVNGYWVG